MIESMEWLRTLILDFPSFEYIIILVGATFGGELALFVFGFLAAQSILSILPIIILSFVGAFLPNLLWYFLGKYKMMGKIGSHRYTAETGAVITEAVQRISKGSHLIALIIIKFLVGTPVLLVLYTYKTALSWKKFFYYQSVATILSISVIMPAGYYSGKGFTYVTDVFENLYATIGFVLLLIVAIVGVQIWFEKRFTK